MSSAAILGWVLSRIPEKKEKVYLLGVIARNGILSTLRRSRGSFDLKKRSRIRLQLVLCDDWHGNTGCLVAQNLALLTKVSTLIHEEISLLTVLYLPFRARYPNLRTRVRFRADDGHARRNRGPTAAMALLVALKNNYALLFCSL